MNTKTITRQLEENHQLSFLTISLAYAIFLSALPVEIFIDRNNYLIYAQASEQLLSLSASSGILSLISNEPAWLTINLILSKFISPEETVRAIIFFSAFVTSLIALSNHPRNTLTIIAILLLPQILKNNIIHLRQGLAISIFLIGWFTKREHVKYFLYIVAPLIHSSFFFILAFMAINSFIIYLRITPTFRTALYIVSGIAISLSATNLASILGARQGNLYQSSELNISGLGFAFWLSFSALFLFQERDLIKRNSLIIFTLIFYLSTYFFMPLSARIFEGILLLTLASGISFTSATRKIFYLLFAFYFLAQWGTRIELPGLGWTIENYL